MTFWTAGISIHAPAWGATRDSFRQRNVLLHFNPRARVGRDFTLLTRTRATRHFNPRARVGRDGFELLPQVVVDVFQSTRPRGARHEGEPLTVSLVLISIHAPAWGATQFAASDAAERRHFNPRARVGRD